MFLLNTAQTGLPDQKESQDNAFEVSFLAKIVVETRASATLHKKSLFERRLDQFKQIMVSPEWESGDSAQKLTMDELCSAEEISNLKKLMQEGLSPIELKIMVALERQQKGSMQILVVGCGIGRECFALDQRGHKVTGIDYSDAVIAKANEMKSERVSKVQFLQSELKDVPPVYDVMWITDRTVQLIPGNEKRIEFFKMVKDKALPTGRVVFSPKFMSFFGHPNYTWSSRLIKHRWRKLGIWSPGDVAEPRRIDSPHSNRLLFFHYYPKKQDALLEIATAGLGVDTEIEHVWIIKP